MFEPNSINQYSKPSEELVELLKFTPISNPSLKGRQADQRTDSRAYKPHVDKFLDVMKHATNAPFMGTTIYRGQTSYDKDICELEYVAIRPSGFRCAFMASSDRCDSVEGNNYARKCAYQFEADACVTMMLLLKVREFCAGIRTAHAEMVLGLCRRTLKASDLASLMMEHAVSPELKGDGLPEMARRIVRHGALATALWLAIVEDTDVGAIYGDILDIADAKASIESFEEEEDYDD